MMMRIATSTIGLRMSMAVIGLMVFITASGQSHRTVFNFNAGWKVQTGDVAKAEEPGFDDTHWKTVTLPYAWNQEEAFKRSIYELSTGIAWYRKHFRISKEHEGKKVFLEFEGIRQAGEFYLNGKYIGIHENGAMAFGFDITDLVKTGKEENVLAVRINNDWDYKERSSGTKFQWSDRNFNANYGGITKNTYLHITDKLYQTLPLYRNLGTTGVYVYAKDIDISKGTATVFAESQVTNAYPIAKTFQYEVMIQDLDGKTIHTIAGDKSTVSPNETITVKAGASLKNLHWWSWGYGYLYTVSTIIKVDNKVVDIVKTRTGFRKTEFANGMVLLNDRVLQMKGYAQRTSNEWPAVGLSVPPWVSDLSNGLMIESNANLVRWMHITPSKQDIESCDRVGLMQAMPAGDAEKDVNDHRWVQRKELMRDAIIYNRNNPSILFYECGNESISEAHMQEMKAIRDQYDPYGGRAIGSREMLDSKEAEYGGEMLYINKSAHIPMWAMEYSRDEGLRKYWDEFSPPYHKDGDGPLHKNTNANAYNRNQDSHAVENVIRWYDYWKERPGTGARVSSGGVNIIFSDSNTHSRGAENYRRSGEVDPMRIPKDGFYAHQVMWDGWVDTRKDLIHIAGHWNYENGIRKNIYVFSGSDHVELICNGQSLGIGEKSYEFLHTFKDITFKPGTLIAVGYDARNNKVCETKLTTAGTPAAIRLTAHESPQGLKADGADLALIDVEVIDAEGRRCPAALNMIDFSIEGAATWLGGIAQGPDNYILSKSLPVECGINRVMVRTTTAAGKIIVNAASSGLKPATVSLTSKPVKVIDGLTTLLPGKTLKPSLKRGPTPEGSSYTITRVPVKIIGATGGSGTDSLTYSFDDNELTRWASNGQLSSAWIRYDLERTTKISELTFKVADWRNRIYPVRIVINGTEVFKGNTTPSLGYQTITFPPVMGKDVRIELIDANSERDAFNSIVEITGKKDDRVKEGSKSSGGNLSIVEMEVYAPVELQGSGD